MTRKGVSIDVFFQAKIQNKKLEVRSIYFK